MARKPMAASRSERQFESLMIDLSNSGEIPQSAPARAPQSGLIAWIERRPESAFCAFLATHLAVWTALPTLLYANLPLDLIEALTYGREWPLGSDKLPPLPWWLVEITYRVFGADVAYYGLAEISVVGAFVAVWALARPLVGPVGALVAVLIIDGMHYFQYTAVKFNHDVIQLPIWAVAGLSYHAALKRKRLSAWIWCGIAVGLALWAKYFVVVLAAPLVLFLLFDREARPAWRTAGPWVAIGVAFAIMLPHLVWLVEHQFLPFAYANARATRVRGWYDHLWHPAFFVGGQLLAVLPSLFIAGPLLWPRAKPSNQASGGVADALDRRIVTLLAFGPALTMVAMIAASGRGAVIMWGYPLGIFLGLWIVLFAPNALDSVRLRRIVGAWTAIFVALALAFIANYTVKPMLDHRYRAAFFPGDTLATELTQRFHEATGGKKLRYVIGTMWLGGNIGHYSPDQPEVLIDGLPGRAPWINLDDLRAKGAILVWNLGDLDRLPAAFATIAPTAQVGTPFTLSARRFGSGVEHIGWAILMPQ